MHKTHHMPRRSTRAKTEHTNPLLSSQTYKTILNLRGDAGDPAFVQGVQNALHTPLPTASCSTIAKSQIRVVWAGPDDWFVIAEAGLADELSARLRQHLVGQHVAITDVSSGYFVVSLGGRHARDTLSHGCPIDFHPAEFTSGKAVGTHFFKVSLYCWLREDAPTDTSTDAPIFEMLVRRSFIDHFWQLIEQCSLEWGWETPDAA